MKVINIASVVVSVDEGPLGPFAWITLRSVVRHNGSPDSARTSGQAFAAAGSQKSGRKSRRQPPVSNVTNLAAAAAARACVSRSIRRPAPFTAAFIRARPAPNGMTGAGSFAPASVPSTNLSRVFRLSQDEHDAVSRHEGALPVGITPYYASLMGLTDASEPLRRTHIMTGDEYVREAGEDDDPLGEDHDTVVPGLVHRYPDRVLFLTTGTCSTYCRYCTRSRLVGNPGGEYQFSTRQWEKALAYLEAHTEVRDVLLSGGDPLTLGDDKLDWLLGRLRAIKHIEFLRIGTKMPVVLPQRVTRSLVRVLKKHHPLWMSLHFTHPAELTPEVTEATARLADAGIPLGSQTVLLKGINDDADVMLPLDARPAEAPGQALLSLSMRPHPRLRHISAPASRRVLRSSRPCAATPPAMPRPCS